MASKPKPKVEEKQQAVFVKKQKDISELSSDELKSFVKDMNERRQFNLFYQFVYQKERPIVDRVPHHADQHGMLGYEDNILDTELQTGEGGKPVSVDVLGLCEFCSKAEESAKEAFKKW